MLCFGFEPMAGGRLVQLGPLSCLPSDAVIVEAHIVAVNISISFCS